MGVSEESASSSTSPPACSLQNSTCALPSKANYIHSKDLLEVKSMVTCGPLRYPGQNLFVYNHGTQHRTHVRFAICCRVKGLGSGRSDPPLSATQIKRPPSGAAFLFVRRTAWGPSTATGSTDSPGANPDSRTAGPGARQRGRAGCMDAPSNPPLSASCPVGSGFSQASRNYPTKRPTTLDVLVYVAKRQPVEVAFLLFSRSP